MDSSIILEILRDAGSAAKNSESSALFPWLTSALGLSGMSWHRMVAKYIDPNHPLAPSRLATGTSGGGHSSSNDIRLSDIFEPTQDPNQITLADVIGSSAENLNLSDVVGN